MSRKQWTNAEVDLVKSLYPDMRASIIAGQLGCKVHQVYRKANSLGLRKSEAFYSGDDSGRTNGGIGRGTRFFKGHSTWNKGTHFVASGRSAETRFPKGLVPANHRPVGSTRVSVDGYVEIKIAEGMHKWRLLHRENWKKAHGEYPAPGTALVFKDGNKQNCEIENLELLTRKELMGRNSVHNLPEEIKEVVRLNGVLRRKINGK